MDTSEQYVKMCREAVEIRKEWKPRWSDYFYGKCLTHCGDEELSDNVYRYNESDEDCWHQTIPSGKVIWLPRQDQLQKIMGSDWRDVLSRFMWWYSDIEIEQLETMGSMEQLWLACMMKCIFKKIWNGEEWINVE